MYNKMQNLTNKQIVLEKKINDLDFSESIIYHILETENGSIYQAVNVCNNVGSETILINSQSHCIGGKYIIEYINDLSYVFRAVQVVQCKRIKNFPLECISIKDQNPVYKRLVEISKQGLEKVATQRKFIDNLEIVGCENYDLIKKKPAGEVLLRLMDISNQLRMPIGETIICYADGAVIFMSQVVGHQAQRKGYASKTGCTTESCIVEVFKVAQENRKLWKKSLKSQKEK